MKTNIAGLSFATRPCEGSGLKPVYIVECGAPDCDRTVEFPRNSMKGGGDDNAQIATIIGRKLDAVDWAHKSGLKRIRCPQCQQEKQERSEQKMNAKVTPIKAEQPKALDRVSRRKIADFLEGCYDTEEGRYLGSYSDTRVSEEMKIPRAWVSEVRVQLFGDEDVSEESAKVLSEAEKLQQALSDLEAFFQQEVNKLSRSIKALTQKARA